MKLFVEFVEVTFNFENIEYKILTKKSFKKFTEKVSFNNNFFTKKKKNAPI